MAVNWPTHVAKTRERKSLYLRMKKRNRRLRRLHKDGKRGEAQ